MLALYHEPIIQKLNEGLFDEAKVEVYIKREDLIHPMVSGNKWRKLKYNLVEAKRQNFHTLLTFGGAYSNHIYATAAAAKEAGFKSIGIIRGEEHPELNETLSFATSQGMVLSYMDRTTYRQKNSTAILNGLKDRFGECYIIPEGGTNALAISGAKEVVDENVKKFDYLCVSVGTGGTMAGLITGMEGTNEVLGFSSLKGEFLSEEVEKLLLDSGNSRLHNWSINTQYHFGGYAKVKPQLMEFMHRFESQHQILLDPVYTGKMMFGIYEMIKNGHFKSGSRILAVHTGGLQGRVGFGL
ncbi:MAG: pyridoxal-phosphate dependent enzyme [Bacteroidota bacterium]